MQVIELLLGAGADVRAKNDGGEKPMDLVRSEAVLALLLSAAQEADKQEDEEVRDDWIIMFFVVSYGSDAPWLERCCYLVPRFQIWPAPP